MNQICEDSPLGRITLENSVSYVAQCAKCAFRDGGYRHERQAKSALKRHAKTHGVL